jgi:Mg2+-importing ATPase
MPDKISAPAAYWSLTADGLLGALGTTPEGLTSAEAARRLKELGPNALVVHKRATRLGLFLKQFKSPLVLILIFATLVSGFARDWVDAGVILAIVLGSAIITFYQENAASNAVESLRARLVRKVTVVRDGQNQMIPVEELVPGDILLLSAGSLVPADAIVLEAKDFFVSQAVLTGETFPVEKSPSTVAADASLAERTNCVFMGTSVRSGTARALAVQTGLDTAYGQIADRLSLAPPETEFERGIRQFGYMLSRVMVVLILVVFAMNIISAKPPIDALLFAIALAVGISPELLPAIISINLSTGARDMARKGVIVRQLNAIENLGSMDVLCTDKTGTLTEGVVGLQGCKNTMGEDSDEIFRLAFLNAHFQTGLSNPLDDAITAKPLDVEGVKKLDEVPYDFVRKRLSIVVEDRNRHLLITKGALDNVLSVSSQFRAGAEGAATVQPLDAEARNRIEQKFAAWSDQGFRVLGVAFREVDVRSSYTKDDEHELIFAGFLLFFDPPKTDVSNTIVALQKLGVRLKIITGDNRRVAEHVAKIVALPVEGVLSGRDLASLRDEALWHQVEHTDLFVDVDPNQKERIIRALKRAGHVVGYMGDGINDAPALHDADVGISVDSAVDVAREAASFVLLRSSLDVLRQGIEEGRITFANSLKYVFTTTSANFGNMFSMAGASVFLTFLPLLPKQILLNNFLSDIPALAIAQDHVDPEMVEKPHRWDVRFIRNFMIIFGLISSVFDFLTFGVLLNVVRAAPPLFRSGWFVESLLTELLVAMVVRTRRPFYRSRPGRGLLLSTLGIAAITLVITYLPFNNVLGFVPLPPTVMGLIIIITVLYVLVTEISKRIFYRKLGPTL